MIELSGLGSEAFFVAIVSVVTSFESVSNNGELAKRAGGGDLDH